MRKEISRLLPKQVIELHKERERTRVWEVRNLKKFHKKSVTFKRPIDQYYERMLFSAPGGIAGWIVDSPLVKLELDIDFGEGGHGYRYLYVPILDVWISNDLRKENIEPTVWHELAERELMKNSENYNNAHDFASRFEMMIRSGGYGPEVRLIKEKLGLPKTIELLVP